MPRESADSRFMTLDELREIDEAVAEAKAAGDWRPSDWQMLTSGDWTLAGKETDDELCDTGT